MGTDCKNLIDNRPLSFILLSHSNNQSESTTKFYNSSKVDIGGNVLTLTLSVPRSDRTESVWMPTDLVKFLVHSIHLLRKKLWHLTIIVIFIFFWVNRFGGGEGCYPHLRSKCVWYAYVCVCVCVCVSVCMHACFVWVVMYYYYAIDFCVNIYALHAFI